MTADRFYMERALSLAETAGKAGEIPVGAVIADKNGSIIGMGENTREREKNALGHAELNAVSEACRTIDSARLHGCTLYSTLEPCPMCAGACVSAGIELIVFGAYDKKNGAVCSAADLSKTGFTHIPVYRGGVLEKECAALLTDFFKKLRREKRSLTFSSVGTEYHIRVCAEIIGSPTDIIKENILAGTVYRFIRKNGKTAGIAAFEKSGINIFIKKEYGAYVSEEDVLNTLSEEEETAD